MAKPLNEAAVEKRIAADFRALEEAAPPGILDLVQVYGGYAQAIKQADVYFGLLAPAMAAPISSNSSAK